MVVGRSTAHFENVIWSGKMYLKCLIVRRKIKWMIVSKFTVIIVPADVLAPLGARTSADTVMIEFRSHILKTLNSFPQNGRHCTDYILKCIFLNENVWILLKISLKFVPNVRINNIPALVQIMTWHQPVDKPLYKLMMVTLLMYICITQPQWVTERQPRIKVTGILLCPSIYVSMDVLVTAISSLVNMWLACSDAISWHLYIPECRSQ